jgi:hypothetical protein
MKKLFTSLTLIAASLTLFGIVPMEASAASNGISVNPRKNFVANPGDTVRDTITVRNLDKSIPLNATITLLDFQAAGQNGSPQLLLTRKEPTRWSLKPYLTVASNVTIAPNGSMDVPITINIPKTAGGGSYYSAIRFGSDGGGATGNVGLTGSATTLAFVRVSGKTNDNLILQKFGAFVPNSDYADGSYKTFFGSSKPKHISYTLKNTGNVADEPIGSIQINNMFGKQFAMIKNINPNHNLVLIDQTRRVDVCVIAPPGSNDSNTADSVMNISKCEDPAFWPGRYTAKIDLLYGTNGSPSNEIRTTTSFWYIPAWSIIAVIVLLLLLAGIVWLVVNAIRSARGRKYRRR